MLSTYAPARQPSPLPRRTDSLSTSIAKPKPSSPLIQSREDAALARIFLGTPATNENKNLQANAVENASRRDDRERQLTEMLSRMTGWVEELATLLQQAYKDQTDLETALTLTRSNLQLALANNEMLEEALKRGGGGGQDVGWRRWSEREGVRRSGSVKDYGSADRPNSLADIPQQQQQPPSAPSRFFNFKSPLQRISSTNTSPTTTSASPPYASASASASVSSLLPSISIPSTSRSQSPAPPPPPSTTTVASSVPSSSRTSSPSPTHVRNSQPATQFHASAYSATHSTAPTAREKELTALLDKERASLKALAAAKAQVEDELESLSQALFEEANKMVSIANRKLAETEEELRIATEQKEALRGALRIVEGENGALRGNTVEREADVKREQFDARGVTGNEGGLGSHDAVQTGQEPSKLRPRPSPIPTRSVPSSHPHARPIPDVTVSDPHLATSSKLKSFWSPVTPLSDSERTDGELPTTASGSPNTPSHTLSPTLQLAPTPGPHTDAQGSVHRWSVLPVSPRARNAVRGEFEDALRRMRELIGEGGDDDDASSVVAVAEGRKHESKGEGVGEGSGKADCRLGESKRDEAGAAQVEGV